MPSGRQEVDAAVHAAVRDPPLPVDVEFLPKVLLILLVHVVHDGLPAEERSRKTWRRRGKMRKGEEAEEEEEENEEEEDQGEDGDEE